MEQFESIEHVLVNMNNKTITQKKDSVLPGIIYLACAVAVFVVNSLTKNSVESFLPYLLIILGIALVTIALIKIFFRKDHFISSEHGKLIKKEIDLDFTEKDKLVKLLQKGDIEGIKNLKKAATNSLILKLYISKDGKEGFSQVLHFVNFGYETINEVKQHTENEVAILKSI